MSPSAVPPSNSLKTISLLTFKVIAPFDELTTFIPVLDLIKEVPSVRFVKDPEKPKDAVTKPADCSAFVVLLYVRSASPPKEPPSLNCTCVFAPPGVPPPPVLSQMRVV